VPFIAEVPGQLLVQGGLDDGLGQHLQQPVRTGQGQPRYIYSVPEGRGFGRWTWYDFLALSLMIRGVLSPDSETRVDC
jgi:hypothetical protein